MKTKYFLIYVALGAAFLGVSLWVLLSGGKNAKAVNAKYRLGGLMLTAWAMLTAASCAPGEGLFQVTCYDVAEPPSTPPEVMCYDPIVDEPTENFTFISLKGKQWDAYNSVQAGDVFLICIQKATYPQYVFKIGLNDTEGTPLQQTVLTIPEGMEAESIFEVPLSAEIDYKGEAIAEVKGVETEDPITLSTASFAITVINLK